MEHSKFEFDIRPFDGVGPVKFGMTKQDFAHLFTHVYTSFFKVTTNKYRSDHNEYVGLIVHYDDEGKIEEIEILPNPQYTDTKLYFDGTEITHFTMDDAWKFFKKRAKDWQKDTYGYTSRKLGIAIYRHNWESKNDPVDSYYIWKHGVWEDVP